MFNLIVTGKAGTWGSGHYGLPADRVFEYTASEIATKYRSLDDSSVRNLRSLPTLFAYEDYHKADARLGALTGVRKQWDEVRFEYELSSVLPVIPSAAIADLTPELDIGKWEMNRTHWAVKRVDLRQVFVHAGLLSEDQGRILLRGRYKYDVALSFAGEDRAFVEQVRNALASRQIQAFYDQDSDVIAELWGEDLTGKLADTYFRRAEYAMLFISDHYAKKAWPRQELRAALARGVTESSAYILPVRLDDTELPGLLPTVNYLDARKMLPDAIAQAFETKLRATKSRIVS